MIWPPRMASRPNLSIIHVYNRSLDADSMVFASNIFYYPHQIVIGEQSASSYHGNHFTGFSHNPKDDAMIEADPMLYLPDNAGETGFDRIFAEEIAKKYPHMEITFCVRGDIANNDATREDAAAVGVPFPVIDNGNRIAGTQMDQLSCEAETAIKTADVIIAKGMANTETMFGCGFNVYYAFLIKCQRFVTDFGRPMFTPMLVRDSK